MRDDNGGPPVHKTYKLYIGGAFGRSESGRTLPLRAPSRAKKTGRKKPDKPKVLAQIARASRKDLRNATEAAVAAGKKWRSATAVLRGQILYRMAEMLDARASEFESLLMSLGVAKAQARDEVETSADRLVWYAGWCDKLSQAIGTVNPVSGPYFNFSMPEPTGVVAVVPPPDPALLGLVSTIAPVLVPGNSVVVVADVAAAPVAITLAEVAATSDVPDGVVNILTGTRDELLPHLATHREVSANFLVSSKRKEIELVEREAADHIKRGLTLPARKLSWWKSDSGQDLAMIRAFCEIKTAWHTMGY